MQFNTVAAALALPLTLLVLTQAIPLLRPCETDAMLSALTSEDTVSSLSITNAAMDWCRDVGVYDCDLSTNTTIVRSLCPLLLV